MRGQIVIKIISQTVQNPLTAFAGQFSPFLIRVHQTQEIEFPVFVLCPGRDLDVAQNDAHGFGPSVLPRIGLLTFFFLAFFTLVLFRATSKCSASATLAKHFGSFAQPHRRNSGQSPLATHGGVVSQGGKKLVRSGLPSRAHLQSIGHIPCDLGGNRSPQGQLGHEGISDQDHEEGQDQNNPPLPPISPGWTLGSHAMFFSHPSDAGPPFFLPSDQTMPIRATYRRQRDQTDRQ